MSQANFLTSILLATLFIVKPAYSLNSSVTTRDVKFVNYCDHPIWIAQQTNANGKDLPGGIAKVSPSNSFTYSIPDEGWSGRFWPKTGCNSKGQECSVGQSLPPCGTKGCQPPASTQVDFHFPAIGNSDRIFYDITLVNGYTLPVSVDPSTNDDTCKETSCAIPLNNCPTNEKDVGDLRIKNKGKTIMCLSPCKKWNYPPPYGMGRSEDEEPGRHLCCPGSISPQDCKKRVTKTKYVRGIQGNCPTVYSHPHDAENGLHNCPNDTNFIVSFCSGKIKIYFV